MRKVNFDSFKINKGPKKARTQNEAKRYFIRSMDHEWVKRAATLPGRALHIGIGIWFYAGLFKKKFGQPFHVSVSRIARDFEIKPATARRGFKALEQLSLIDAKRKSGKKCEVTLLDPFARTLQSDPEQDNNPDQPIFDSPQSEKSNLPEKMEGVS